MLPGAAQLRPISLDQGLFDRLGYTFCVTSALESLAGGWGGDKRRGPRP